MGATTSKKEQSDEEREASSLGSLPLLHSSFSILSLHSPFIPLSSLQQCFTIKSANISCERAELRDGLQGILDQISASIVDTLFVSHPEGINWVEFLKGYVTYCGRMSASSRLNVLFRVIVLSAERAGCPMDLHFDSNEVDCKTSGSLSPRELGIILWICWIMSSDSWTSQHAVENEPISLPDLSHLVLSAVVTCADNNCGVDVWGFDGVCVEPKLSAGKIYMWAIRMVPNLADCFSNFINSRLKRAAASEPTGAGDSSTISDIKPLLVAHESHLLTRGRAWALSLSQRSDLSEEILRICFPTNINMIEESLLYRSCVHGKGLNRFWSHVEGYHGPLLVLISASSDESSESSHKWIIAAVTQEGFENKDVFYGSGGCLYSICPVFQVFSASGRQQNYVYSHLHPAMRAYEPHPKPVGIAFGGSTGNERVFVDEDFAKVTVRHHAVDKTYHNGPLFPDQGYLPVEAALLDVEVWGLGGKTAKGVQLSYKKREELFTEQRRKVDLKTFASWEDSPEKMIVDLMSNPNTVRREDR